jgi:hypothetical protein
MNINHICPARHGKLLQLRCSFYWSSQACLRGVELVWFKPKGACAFQSSVGSWVHELTIKPLCSLSQCRAGVERSLYARLHYPPNRHRKLYSGRTANRNVLGVWFSEDVFPVGRLMGRGALLNISLEAERGLEQVIAKYNQ